MKLKASLQQIHLTHPKDVNFSALFEEVFSKHGKKVRLFAVAEVENEGKQLTSEKKKEYEKLAETLEQSFKKAYVSAESLNEHTFEQALTSVNAALSKLAGREKVTWFGRMNAVLAAFYDNKLSIAVTGKAYAYLFRDDELSLITEEEREEIKLVKIFSSYTTGGLTEDDRVLLAGGQIFNYLSIERLSQIMREKYIEDAREDLVKNLREVKEAGFSVLMLEAGYTDRTAEDAEEEIILPDEPKGKKPPVAVEKIKSQKTVYFVLVLLWSLTKKALTLLWKGLRLIFSLFKRNSRGLRLSSVLKKPRFNKKKVTFTAVIVAVAVLGGSIAIAAINKSANEKKAELSQTLTEIDQHLSEAEGALIYRDEETAVQLLGQAETLFLELKQEYKDRNFTKTQSRIEQLKSKVQKQTQVEPTVLASYQNIPTDLVFSSNGLLGFNQNTGSLAFYDFRTGETSEVLSGENTGGFVQSMFVGGSHGYVLMTRDGSFQRLNTAQDAVTEYEDSNPAVSDMNQRSIRSAFVFGTGDAARVYLLDTASAQILRLNVNEQGVTSPENWLSGPAPDFSEALDLAIDGSIYVLFPDRLEKYFAGNKESFKLAPLIPELRDAAGIYTSAELDGIYVLDPESRRVVQFDKQGGLVNQLISDKFAQAQDLYVSADEEVLYVLAGSEILQINLE